MRTARQAMSTVRRLGKDESGMTLGLTMVMIVLIGVMGAGLLTFVSTDLSTVLEVNRGQRAFEVADAGVGVAKRQLTEDCRASTTCWDHYDDLNGGEYPWSPASGGVTINDLDGDVGTEDNSVHVTIDYRFTQDDFKVVSTGNYGVAKRKIEAIFEGVSGAGAGSGLGHPTYYTPSNIKIEGDLTLTGVSLLTERDILIQGLTSPTVDPNSFKTYNESDNTLHFNSNRDNLRNWDSTSAHFVQNGNDGFWNTQGRLTYVAQNGSRSAYDKPGFAALGKICGYTVSSTTTCAGAASVADGVYGYDSTTGSNIAPLDTVTGYPERCPTSTDPLNPKTNPLTTDPHYPWQGNKWAFCEKPQDLIDNEELNAPGTISFPFPRPVPSAQKLRGYAQETNRYWAWGDGGSTSPPWNSPNFFPNAANPDKVVFIDAQGHDISFNPTPAGSEYKGILVVWCGNLTMDANFQGIVLSLYPDGKTGSELPGGSMCTNEEGTYRNNVRTMSGWLYAAGGNATRAGVELAPGSTMSDLPNGNRWSFFNDAFTGIPPTSFQIKGWRELYE